MFLFFLGRTNAYLGMFVQVPGSCRFVIFCSYFEGLTFSLHLGLLLHYLTLSVNTLHYYHLTNKCMHPQYFPPMFGHKTLTAS